MLNLQLEGHGLKNMGPRLSLSRHTQDRCRSISRRKYDPSVDRTAKSYFTTIVKKKQKQSRQNWMAVQNTMVHTIVVTSKHGDCNLMFIKPQKGGWNIPSKRDSKAQNKDQRSIVTACTNT